MSCGAQAPAGTLIASPSLFDLSQVYELRIQIEGHCAALAARNAWPPDVTAISTAFSDADRANAQADWRRLVCCDHAFHQAMAASRNVWLERTLVTLHNSALRFWHYALPRRPVEAVKAEIASHSPVAAAITAHDSEVAQAAMRTILVGFPATVHGMLFDSSEPTT
jgi:DNA-binding GntR family transcriptional regulator